MSMITHQKQPYSKPYPQWAIKAMDEVLKLQGAKRWRASGAIWLNLNQVQESGLTARQEYYTVVEDLKAKRSELKNKFGEIAPGKAGLVSSADSLRENLELPEGLWTYIKMFDKLAFDKSNPDCRKNLTKLAKEFKELSVAEAF
jgi:hypothetical protein